MKCLHVLLEETKYLISFSLHNAKKVSSGIDHYVNRRLLCPSSVSVSRQPTAFCQGKFFIRFKTLLAISIDTKSA